MSKKIVRNRFKKIKKITDKQYLVFRSIKTGKITKYRKDRQFIVEVRSRKSKKLQGVLNTIAGKGKNRKVIPRKFTNLQLQLKQTRKSRKAKVIILAENSFQVNFARRIFPQYARAGRNTIQTMLDQLKMNGDLIFSQKIELTKGRVFETGTQMITDAKFSTLESLIDVMAADMINTLRENQIRTSGKKHINESSVNQKRKPVSTGTVTVRWESLK